MKAQDWMAEVETIDGELRRLLERRSQVIAGVGARGREQPPGYAEAAPARADVAGARYAASAHPDAHLAAGDLP